MVYAPEFQASIAEFKVNLAEYEIWHRLKAGLPIFLLVWRLRTATGGSDVRLELLIRFRIPAHRLDQDRPLRTPFVGSHARKTAHRR